MTSSAEKEETTAGGIEKMTNEPTDPTMHAFMKDELAKQMDKARISGDSLSAEDEERAAKFLARALSESARMNKEVEASNKKQSKLHEQFGTEIFERWRDEHAALVLTPEETVAMKSVEADPSFQ